MQAEVMKITPLMAKEALSRNTVNRRISDSRVSMYADDMRRGEWQLNGEAIVFSEDGTLINGQHRLAAIVRSGCTVQMLVVKGVKDDPLLKRTAAQWQEETATKSVAVSVLCLSL